MILGKEPHPSGPQVPQVHNNVTLSAIRVQAKPSHTCFNLKSGPKKTSSDHSEASSYSLREGLQTVLAPAWFPPFPHVERRGGMGGEIPGRLAARHETVEGRTECNPAPPATTSASSCFCRQAFPQGIVHSWPARNCRMPAVHNTHVQDGRICELRAASPELGVMPSLVFGVQ